jgi:hypothetical protein
LEKLTFESLQVFLVIILPGFIAMKVYDLFYPPEKRSFGDSLVDAVAYGLFNFCFWSWAIVGMDLRTYPTEHPIWFPILFLLSLVVSPAALAFGLVKIRTWRWLLGKLNLDEPTKTAWDKFAERKQPCFMLFHLKNGEFICGWFGDKSYATTFPQKPEVFVEKIYAVDQETRVIQHCLENSLGMVIRAEDCHLIEFFAAVTDEKPTETIVVQPKADQAAANQPQPNPEDNGHVRQQ